MSLFLEITFLLLAVALSIRYGLLVGRRQAATRSREGYIARTMDTRDWDHLDKRDQFIRNMEPPAMERFEEFVIKHPAATLYIPRPLPKEWDK